MECLQNPCHPRCPNAPNPEILGECTQCGDELTYGYPIYTDSEGNKFCGHNCADKYWGIKEWLYDLEDD